LLVLRTNKYTKTRRDANLSLFVIVGTSDLILAAFINSGANKSDGHQARGCLRESACSFNGFGHLCLIHVHTTTIIYHGAAKQILVAVSACSLRAILFQHMANIACGDHTGSDNRTSAIPSFLLLLFFD
jgi:hypothetical protein